MLMLFGMRETKTEYIGSVNDHRADGVKITFFNLYRKGYPSSQIEITGNPAFDKNILPIDKIKHKILIALPTKLMRVQIRRRTQ